MISFEDFEDFKLFVMDYYPTALEEVEHHAEENEWVATEWELKDEALRVAWERWQTDSVLLEQEVSE